MFGPESEEASLRAALSALGRCRLLAAAGGGGGGGGIADDDAATTGAGLGDERQRQQLGRLGVVPRAIQEVLLALEQRRQLASAFSGMLLS
eukprot:COSAG01_NODE_3204_length_6415_cov_3.116364_4_plen_91_part_00